MYYWVNVSKLSNWALSYMGRHMGGRGALYICAQKNVWNIFNSFSAG